MSKHLTLEYHFLNPNTSNRTMRMTMCVLYLRNQIFLPFSSPPLAEKMEFWHLIYHMNFSSVYISARKNKMKKKLEVSQLLSPFYNLDFKSRHQ
jgi:hypothetical protein